MNSNTFKKLIMALLGCYISCVPLNASSIVVGEIVHQSYNGHNVSVKSDQVSKVVLTLDGAESYELIDLKAYFDKDVSLEVESSLDDSSGSLVVKVYSVEEYTRSLSLIKMFDVDEYIGTPSFGKKPIPSLLGDVYTRVPIISPNGVELDIDQYVDHSKGNVVFLSGELMKSYDGSIVGVFYTMNGFWIMNGTTLYKVFSRDTLKYNYFAKEKLNDAADEILLEVYTFPLDHITVDNNHGIKGDLLATKKISLRGVLASPSVQPLPQGKSNLLKAYPNPGVGQLNITLTTPLSADGLLTIVDASGKTLVSKVLPSGTSSLSQDLSSYPQGTYFIKVVMGTEVYETTYQLLGK